MIHSRELTLPPEHATREAFMRFKGRIVEAFAGRAPAGTVRDAIEIAGRAFAGDPAAWRTLVRTIAALLVFASERGLAAGELRAFVEENADLLAGADPSAKFGR